MEIKKHNMKVERYSEAGIEVFVPGHKTLKIKKIRRARLGMKV